MHTPSRTTEFSAHLSWAAMGRYLQGTLSADKAKSVERHLRHCPRCSAAIIDYIRAEEPEHYKQYTKKLKGILNTNEETKKSAVSSFQVKAIRTATAVVALLIFSFFALKTVINKQAEHPLPSESLAVVEKSKKAVPARHRLAKKTTKTPSKVAGSPRKPIAVQQTKPVAAKPKSTKPMPIVKKERTVPTPPLTKSSSPPAQDKKPVSKPAVTSAKPIASTTAATPKAPAAQEATAEVSAEPAAVKKPLPALKKIEANQDSKPAAAAPLSNQPEEMPLPRNQIRER